jgi:hypothetical protein
MTYSPINTEAYIAAFAGAIAGMAVSGWITSSNPSDYENTTIVAGAFAQAFDIQWNDSTQLNSLELAAITSIVQTDFNNRGPGPVNNVQFQNASNWSVAAAACTALVLESDAFFTGQGINPGQFPINIPNIAALIVLPVNILPDGYRIWLQTLRCSFTLRTTSDSLVPFERIASSTTGRVWERVVPSPNNANQWVSQTQWYINESTGNDENNGITNPIQTEAELIRRWLGGTITKKINVDITGNVGSIIGTVDVQTGGYILIDGSAAVSQDLTATVSLSTAISRAGQEYNLLSLTGVTDLTPYIGHRVRITQGANAGAIGWISRVNPNGAGVGVARVSFWDFYNVANGEVFKGDSTNKLPSVGNTVVVEHPTAAIEAIRLVIKEPPAFGPGVFTIANAIINASGLYPITFQLGGFDGPDAAIYGCQVNGGLLRGGIYAQCLIDPQSNATHLGNNENTDPIIFQGCLYKNAGGTYGSIIFTGGISFNPLFQNVQLHCPVSGDTQVSAAAAVFDITGAHPAVLIEAQNRLTLADGIFGAGNANFGMRIVGPFATVDYPTAFKPSVTGASGDLQVLGIALTWAGGVPFFNTTNGTGIVAK